MPFRMRVMQGLRDGGDGDHADEIEQQFQLRDGAMPLSGIAPQLGAKAWLHGSSGCRSVPPTQPSIRSCKLESCYRSACGAAIGHFPGTKEYGRPEHATALSAQPKLVC